jgi:hypothetical protein
LVSEQKMHTLIRFRAFFLHFQTFWI